MEISDIARDLATDLPSFQAESLADLMAADEKPAKTLPPAWATVNLPKELAVRTKPSQRIYYDFSEVANAIGRIQPLPGPDETVHAIMDSTFKGIDLVPAIIQMANQPAMVVVITTLGFNRRDAACLCELVEHGQIKRLAMVCSNFFAEKDMGAYNYAQEHFSRIGARLGVARNHSKIILFDFGQSAYVIESSANLRSCMNFEQFTLTNSRALYDFHLSWISRML